MDISKINSSVLRGLIKLTEKRDSLLKQLQEVDDAIAKVYGGAESAAGRRGKSIGAASKGIRRGKRGALKEKILTALKAAGDKGVAVKELSAKLGVKNQNVHVWFSSTGKKLGTIQRIGEGRYRLKAGA